MEARTPGYVYDNVSGNYYDKYHSRSPIARALVRRFLSSFDELVRVSGATAAFEVGCGEGYLSMRMLRSGLRVRGIDREADSVERAQRIFAENELEPAFSVGDLYQLAPQNASELVVCCEVLEHVPAPEHALERLITVAKPWLLLSVPREPLWRCLNIARGKYLPELGNTPGHIQHWSTRGFLELVSRHTRVMEVRTPLPWTMVLCRCD